MIDLLFAGLILLYLVPMLVAHRRAHPHANSIEILNLLLGWTVVGWFVALLWARSISPVEFYVTQNGNPPAVDDYLRIRR